MRRLLTSKENWAFGYGSPKRGLPYRNDPRGKVLEVLLSARGPRKSSKVAGLLITEDMLAR